LTTLKVVQQIQLGSHEIIRFGHINYAFSATIVTRLIHSPDMGELQERKMDYKEKKILEYGSKLELYGTVLSC
jgi:hypothetical protein